MTFSNKINNFKFYWNSDTVQRSPFDLTVGWIEYLNIYFIPCNFFFFFFFEIFFKQTSKNIINCMTVFRIYKLVNVYIQFFHDFEKHEEKRISMSNFYEIIYDWKLFTWVFWRLSFEISIWQAKGERFY